MEIALYRYSLPLTQPLTFHEKTIHNREGLLVHWAGIWSEIAPLPGFSKESLDEAEAETLAYLQAASAGKPLPDIRMPSVQFGLDCVHRTWPELKHAPLPPYLLLRGARITSSGAGKNGCMTIRTRSN